MNTADSAFRPMLAAESTDERVAEILEGGGFLYASYKLDGIRALVRDGELVSRSLKHIPNLYTQSFFKGKVLMEGLDGELISGAPHGNDVFARASSAFMSHGGEPDLSYWIFDVHDLDRKAPFHERLKLLNEYHVTHFPTEVKLLEQRKIYTVEELHAYEQEALVAGYEGLILKLPTGPYKFGRSTLKQGWMLKLKRFADSEAIVIRVVELQRNQNVPTIDNLGLQKRSTQKAGKVPGGMMGTLECHDIRLNWTFEVGTGFDEAQRLQIWDDRHKIIQRPHYVKYKYLPHGSQDAPRHPVFLSWRDPIDMGEPEC